MMRLAAVAVGKRVAWEEAEEGREMERVKRTRMMRD